MDTTPLWILAICAAGAIAAWLLVYAAEKGAREERDAQIAKAWLLESAKRRTAYLDQSSYDWNAEAEQERMDAAHESRAQRRL